MTDELNERINEWLTWDKNEKTRQEIKDLKDAGETVVLEKLLLNRLHFGTAGLRGKMGAGFSQMNDLVIIQTAQGLCMYLEKQFEISSGVVIGYDARHNSKRFAELTATIFLNRGIRVYFFPRVCPTPFVPFAVHHFQCMCGIMVTASHNPKDDNGYKVYWENGAQITSPHDVNIQNMILAHLIPWRSSWATSIVNGSSLKRDPLEEIEKEYYGIIARNSLFTEVNKKSKIKFTYTAMHGVGHSYMVQAFQSAQLKQFVSVEEQTMPDPEFSTVKYPNPEEKSSLALAFQTADNVGSTVILANDPDADRLAVAEKLKNGKWYVFTGNEIGALLGWWTLFCHKQKQLELPIEDVYMLHSTVSSKILRSMAKVEGFSVQETLTGFKWMGNRAHELTDLGKTVLFAFEEAIGFMCGTAVLDKDGISAGIQVAELTTYLENQGKTLKGMLEDIYTQYGQHLSLNSYFVVRDQNTINRIFTKLSNFKGKQNTYPDSILNGKYKIGAVRDLRNAYDSSEPTLVPKLPTSSSGYMITFTFTNGVVATLRTSGTEPKIKYYTEFCGLPEEQNTEELQAKLKEIVDAIIEEFLQPRENNLIAAED